MKPRAVVRWAMKPFRQLEPQIRVPYAQDLLLGAYPGGLRGDNFREKHTPKRIPWGDGEPFVVDPSDVMQ